MDAIVENPLIVGAIVGITVVLLVLVGHWIDLAREKDDEDGF